MLNLGMITPGNSDIIHRFLLQKTRQDEEIRKWKNQNWDGFCKPCCKVVKKMWLIYECEKTQEYLDKLIINVGIQRVYSIKS